MFNSLRMHILFSRSFWLKLVVGFCLVAARVHAADWASWLGPNGDNVTAADAAFNPDLSKWQVSWKTNVGRGNSSVAIVAVALTRWARRRLERNGFLP